MKHTMDMDQLLKRFAQGNELAFKELFNRFFQSSCVFVSHYVPREVVEDIVQETFVNIWKQKKEFSDIVYFKAYLYKSLRNNALLYLRDTPDSEEISSAVEDEGNDVFASIIVEEVHREIIEAINKLPLQRRKIILLSMEDLSPEEVAEEMKISVNTVKTQKRKAYAFLREELKNMFSLFLGMMA